MKKLITPYCSDFGKVNVVIKNFPDTESYAMIPNINTLKNERVTIYHRLYPEPEKRLFELVLILSRVKQETKNIDLFVPYLPYARQDRENRTGEAVSADILCGLLKSYGAKKLITYDCHFLPKPGAFTRAGLPIENKSAGKQLFIYAKKYFGKQEFCVISPDQGSSYFIENAKGHTSHSLQKTRGQAKSNGKKNGIHADINKIEGGANLENSVKGKNICILDDIIATGGTLIHAIKHLKSLGAKKVIVGATHGVFAGENITEKILKNSCDKIFTTNAILSKNKRVEILKL